MKSGGTVNKISVESIDIELRKIKATKLKRNVGLGFKINEMDEEDIEDFKTSVNSQIAFNQKSDKTNSNFVVKYRIPSFLDLDLEIDAEFAGKIYFKEPFDFKPLSESEKASEEASDYLIPYIMKNVDGILKPIFESMNLQYISIITNVESD